MRFVELVDEGGFADTGVSGNEHQLRPAAGHYAVEAGEQGIDFACSPVQFLGTQQPVWRVMLAKRELVDAALSFPFSETAPKIAFSADSGLVAFLSSFGEQLHNDCRNRARHITQPLAWREWLSRDMGVHPFHRIRSRKRQATDQHLVKCDAKGVKIA